MEEKSPGKIPPKEEDMDMSSSSSSDEATEQRPGQPMKRKLEDEDDQGNKKLKQDYEGNHRQEPKKNMCCPKEFPWISHMDVLLSTLKEGDMVEFDRCCYTHWGVYVGDGVVAHLTAVDASTSNVFTDFCVQEDNYRDVAGTSRLRINNSKDTRYRAYPGRDIKKRALSMVGSTYYNIVLYNCEHFASWCRYGKAVSDQVYAAMTMVGGCCATGVVTNMVLTDRAYMSIHSKKNAPQNMWGSLECMTNGMSYRGAPECMTNGMSYRGAPECMTNGMSYRGAPECCIVLSCDGSMNNGMSYRGAPECPAMAHSTLLSNYTHVDERSWNATNLSEQAIVALPWAVALGACAFAVAKLIHGALTRGKDKKSQKQ